MAVAAGNDSGEKARHGLRRHVGSWPAMQQSEVGVSTKSVRSEQDESSDGRVTLQGAVEVGREAGQLVRRGGLHARALRGGVHEGQSILKRVQYRCH